MSPAPSAFSKKQRIVAQWCRKHAQALEGIERLEWQKFAAFLEMLAGSSST